MGNSTGRGKRRVHVSCVQTQYSIVSFSYSGMVWHLCSLSRPGSRYFASIPGGGSMVRHIKAQVSHFMSLILTSYCLDSSHRSGGGGPREVPGAYRLVESVSRCLSLTCSANQSGRSSFSKNPQHSCRITRTSQGHTISGLVYRPIMLRSGLKVI